MQRQGTREEEQTNERDFSDPAEDQQLPVIRLSLGARPRVTYGQYREQPDDTQQTFCHQESITTPQEVLPDDDSGTETDEDGHLIKQALRAKGDLLKRQAQRKQQSVKRRRVAALRTPGVTLKTLIDENLIEFGNNVLRLEYRGKTETADVDSDGRIHWNGTRFDSPSSFSIHVKRWVNPTRKADDGWKTVKYNGRCLEFYKIELLKRRCRVEGCSSSDPLTLPVSSDSLPTVPDATLAPTPPPSSVAYSTHDPTVQSPAQRKMPFCCST